MNTTLVAVTSAKGSPGCTFVAAGIAASLAAAHVDTLLIDADQEEGGMASLLDLPGAPPIVFDGGPATADTLRSRAVRVDDRLDCIDLAGAAPGYEGRQLCLTARGMAGAIVIDLGHVRNDFTQAVVCAADVLVFVATIDRLGFERADRALGRLPTRPKRSGLAVNRAGRHTLGDGGLLLSERHHMPVFARLGEHPSEVQDLVRRAYQPGRSRLFRRSFRELAACVHDEVPCPVGMWP